MREYSEEEKVRIAAFNKTAKPIEQPINWRNISSGALETERKNLAMLNDALENVELADAEKQSLVWLAGWEISTVRNIVSAFRKKMDLLST